MYNHVQLSQLHYEEYEIKLIVAMIGLSLSTITLLYKNYKLKHRNKKMMDNEELLKITEERYKLIVEATHDGIWEYDIPKKKRLQSVHWLNALGYQENQFCNENSWYQLVHPSDLTNVIEKIDQHIDRQTEYYECEYRIRTSNNSYRWIKERGRALFNEKGIAYRIGGSHTDITEIKNYEETLEYIAYSDPLTSLPNRRYFEEVVTKQFINEDALGMKKAIIYLDLDNFKIINDSLGHDMGDRIIISLACKLSRFISENVSLFRLNGDEYIFYLADYQNKENLELFVKDIMSELEYPVKVGETVIHTTASIGIARYPKDGNKIEELLEKADMAMYKAKEDGKNKYKFFNKSFFEDLKKTVKIESLLRVGIEEKEFVLHYQPKVNAIEMDVIGFEALIRWNNKEIGFIPPNDFIKIAEYTGLIIPLGNWIIKEACEFIKKLNESTGIERTVYVNVSAVQLMQENFNQVLLDIIEECKINPQWLGVEITETVLIKSATKVVHRLKEIRKKGIKIALDDFGKEYSSLNYLKNLPIDVLKIDKLFIDDIHQNNKENIVDIVVALAQRMKLDIIAEGVETKEQLDYLIKNKCNNIQGYIFSKAVPEKDILHTISKIKSFEF